MVTWISVIAVEVAHVGFVDGLTGHGDMTEKVESRMSPTLLWLKQPEERGCNGSLGDDGRRHRLEPEETQSLVWDRLGVRCVSNI